MESHCLPLREIPHTTKLYSTFVEDFERVKQFYGHVPDEQGIQAAAREVRLDAGLRAQVANVLREQNAQFGSGPETSRNIERLAAGAVAIVTGQQVGLFGGPAYSFYKAIACVELAQRLTKLGTDAVPVFWMASEDHDLAEVNHVYWSARGGLDLLELPGDDGAAGRRVGDVLLGAAVTHLVERAVAALAGPWAGEVGAALGEAYRAENTYGFAFGKLMERLLAGTGIILLEPRDARLHRLAAPVYRRAAAEAEALGAGLLERGKALEHGGFHAQVKVTPQSTLLFMQVDARREAVRRGRTGFVAGPRSLTAEELVALVERAPEDFSPNALLRPVVQDALLPTAAYIGGAAEVAYFAQTETLYRRLLGRMSVIVPRPGFTLVEPRVARLLKKYGVTMQDVMRGRQRLGVQLAQQALPRSLARRFARGEEDLHKLLQRLREPVGALDKTLLGAVDTAERKMLYQFQKLRGKVGRAENVRTGYLDRDERMLVDALYPQRGLQERTLSFLPFLAAHGPALLKELGRLAAQHPAQHQVVNL